MGNLKKEQLIKRKQERIERAGKMWQQGMTVTEIAKEIGCGLSTASEYVKESGVKKNRTAELAQKITQMYMNDVTIAKIKNELGVSNTFINAVLKKKGLKKRRFFQAEIDLIDENTVFAEDRLANLLLEKVIIDGKMYEDMSPIFIPR